MVFNAGNVTGGISREGAGRRGSEVHDVNGGIEITGLQGRINAETTNGGVTTRDVSGQLDASTTNGGLDIDMSRVPEGGVKLEFTNGGLKMRMPRDAKATISASITNGGIKSEDLQIESTGENTPPPARRTPERRRRPHSDRRHQRRDHAVRPVVFARRRCRSPSTTASDSVIRPTARAVRLARCATVFIIDPSRYASITAGCT